ncbi:hypothetical protein LJR153_007296 [Paenibacillus sp. LjRoot153]|uniref:hypothetical protein n=1 Tax=Paenibacillus sp. LjRoot153 TaxID=3342270 RepID=UPI003ECDBF4F
MRLVINLAVWSIVFILFMVYDHEDRKITTGELRGYAAAIIAAHDAAVSKEDAKAQGILIFDEPSGFQNYKQSLMEQFQLNSDLTPKANSIFNTPVSIVGIWFLGDDKAPKDAQGKAVYPYNFNSTATYRGQSVAVQEKIEGPSIVGVIQFTHNTTTSQAITFKKGIYRYMDRAFQ